MVDDTEPRMTLPTQLVLPAMLAKPTQEMYGLLVVVVLGVLLLLIATLALAAVYSRDPVRRAAAEKILTRLLGTLRPRGPSTPTPRRRRRTPPPRA